MKNKKTSFNSIFGLAFILFLTILGFIIFNKLNDPLDFRKKAVEKEELNSIPPSQIVDDFKDGEWQFKVSNANNNQSDWNIPGRGNLPDESQVFWRRLIHIQNEKNWTIKVGNGGQIYSISTPQLGDHTSAQMLMNGSWYFNIQFPLLYTVELFPQIFLLMAISIRPDFIPNQTVILI
jgi:hypothetical protein